MTKRVLSEMLLIVQLSALNGGHSISPRVLPASSFSLPPVLLRYLLPNFLIKPCKWLENNGVNQWIGKSTDIEGPLY